MTQFRPYIGYTVAIIGSALALLHFLSLIEAVFTIYVPGFLNTDLSDPHVFSALIGESIVFIVSRGIFASIPCIFLFAALFIFKIQRTWFRYICMFSGIYFCFLFPVGTVLGVGLLSSTRTRSLKKSVEQGAAANP
jgi:hypothetical protein